MLMSQVLSDSGLSAQGHSVTIAQPRPVVYGQGAWGKGPLTPGPVLAGEFRVMRHPRVAHRVGPLVDQPYDPGLASYNATLWPRVGLLMGP